MYVNGVATARVNEQEYSDGWIRAFQKDQIPNINENEKKLLTDYLNCGKIEEIVIYLDKFRNVNGEIAEFLIRELMRGNI